MGQVNLCLSPVWSNLAKFSKSWAIFLRVNLGKFWAIFGRFCMLLGKLECKFPNVKKLSSHLVTLSKSHSHMTIVIQCDVLLSYNNPKQCLFISTKSNKLSQFVFQFGSIVLLKFLADRNCILFQTWIIKNCRIRVFWRLNILFLHNQILN